MHARKQRRSFSGLALKLGLLFLCVYLAVSFVCAQMEIAAKRQQLENISQQVAAQQAAHAAQQVGHAAWPAISWAMRGRTSASLSTVPIRAAKVSASVILRLTVAGTVRFL